MWSFFRKPPMRNWDCHLWRRTVWLPPEVSNYRRMWWVNSINWWPNFDDKQDSIFIASRKKTFPHRKNAFSIRHSIEWNQMRKVSFFCSNRPIIRLWWTETVEFFSLLRSVEICRMFRKRKLSLAQSLSDQQKCVEQKLLAKSLKCEIRMDRFIMEHPCRLYNAKFACKKQFITIA